MSCQRRWTTCLVVSLGVLVLPVAIHAQSTVKWVTMKPLSTLDGKDIYDRECAVCHGTFGRGNGPASKLAGAPAPDLTLIAARDGGFGELHVMHHIVDRRGHGNHMPDWGANLNVLFSRNRGAAHVAALNLTRHIESMQRALD